MAMILQLQVLLLHSYAFARHSIAHLSISKLRQAVQSAEADHLQRHYVLQFVGTLVLKVGKDSLMGVGAANDGAPRLTAGFSMNRASAFFSDSHSAVNTLSSSACDRIIASLSSRS